jgi:uncharacterized UBP type Zn finger protein
VSSQESSESDYAEKAANRRRDAKVKAKLALKAPAKAPVITLKKTESTNSSSSENSQNSTENVQAENSQKNSGDLKQEEPTEEGGIISLSEAKSKPPKLDMSFIVGHGLSNIGNTCYMNSIIQALACNSVLRNELAALITVDESVKPVTNALYQLFCQIKDREQL